MLLLYTSDLHDHLRAGPNGIGGMAYVSGYAKKIRAARADVIAVDAGDVANKGDWVAYASKSALMYKAMKQVRYTAITSGNHDFRYGMPQLLGNAKHVGAPMLCANLATSDGSPGPLPRSRVVDADGVKVGIIGFTLPGLRLRGEDLQVMKLEQTAAVLAQEAARLDEQAHLVVAVGHFPGRTCPKLSGMVPAIDVFVAGHSHEVRQKPTRVPQTGALVVQAGSNARYVGRLELTIDVDTEQVVQYKGRLVELKHDSVPADAEMLRWIDEAEIASCPQARQVLGKAAEDISRGDLARIYARALRQMAEADVGFSSPRSVLSDLKAEQVIDYNAVFASHRAGEAQTVALRATGAALRLYLGSVRSKRACPCWDGFTATMDFTKPGPQRVTQTDLDAEREYSVVMPAKMARSPNGKLRIRAVEGTVKPCAYTEREAMRAYIESLTREGLKVRRIK